MQLILLFLHIAVDWQIKTTEQNPQVTSPTIAHL